MKSQGEIEAAVSNGISKFHQTFTGRGPQDVRVHLVDTLLVVRLTGVLSSAERQLLQPNSADVGQHAASSRLTYETINGHRNGGIGSLFRQIREEMIEAGKDYLAKVVLEASGVQVVNIYHDISTSTWEEIIVFSLAAAPCYRPKRALFSPRANGRTLASSSLGGASVQE